MRTIKEKLQIDGLKFIGWTYFIASVIASIYLFANSKTVTIGRGLSVEKVINPAIIVSAVVLLFSGTLVVILCSAIAHILRNQQALQSGQIEIFNSLKEK